MLSPAVVEARFVAFIIPNPTFASILGLFVKHDF